MTFTTVPGLAFDLGFVGPGSANTNCAGLAIGGSCSVFVGSPFILTLTPTGTAVVLAVGGIARDGTTPSIWSGNFTTSISNQTPLQIQQAFGCAAGQGPAACTHPTATIGSTFAGEFTATFGSRTKQHWIAGTWVDRALLCSEENCLACRRIPAGTIGKAEKQEEIPAFLCSRPKIPWPSDIACREVMYRCGMRKRVEECASKEEHSVSCRDCPVRWASSILFRSLSWY